jgi:hypothetical protein
MRQAQSCQAAWIRGRLPAAREWSALQSTHRDEPQRAGVFTAGHGVHGAAGDVLVDHRVRLLCELQTTASGTRKWLSGAEAALEWCASSNGQERSQRVEFFSLPPGGFIVGGALVASADLRRYVPAQLAGSLQTWSTY